MTFKAFFLALVGLALAGSAYSKSRTIGLYPPDQPPDNLLTNASVALGETLFFDPRLSRSGTLSCATCHDPRHAYSDPRPISVPEGDPVHRRNAPSILNAGYRRSLGWDGAHGSLEHQVESTFGPYGDMGITIGEAIAQISVDPAYVRGCWSAYKSPVDVQCLTRALASFERALVSSNSRFDRFLFGGANGAMSDQERQGWAIFTGRGACIDCHDVFHESVNPLGGAYATFSDERFHNLGVGYRMGIMRDTGRHEVSRDPTVFGAFKTPMLRNVSRTAPYMHDGSLATLEDVVEFYDMGGHPNPNLSAGIRPLFLSQADRTALVAFLRALDLNYYVPTGFRQRPGLRPQRSR